MRIRFLKGDPRAGMVCEVDGELGKLHIANGAAEKVSDNTDGAPPTISEEERAVRVAAAKPEAKKPAGPAAKTTAKKAK